MSDGAHRIRRLQWRIRLGSKDEALALRTRLVRSVKAAIVPELERALDTVAVGDEVIHIARLDATIRIPGTEALEEATAEAIRTSLKARLAELADPRPEKAPVETAVRRSTVRLSKLASLLQYLATGTLPWYAEPETANLDHVRELEETAVSEMAAVAQRLPIAPAETAVFLFRLLSLIPDAGWVPVVQAIARQRRVSDEPALIETIERIAVAPERSSGRHARLELAAAIIAGWFAPVDPPDASPSPIKSSVSSDALRLFDRLALPARLTDPMDGTRRRPESAGSSPAHRVPGASHRPVGADDPRDSATFGAPMFYAGLAVLAPFLPRLFAARNVAHPGDNCVKPEALRRAAALLHFAATGETEGHEYELGFIKILLGVPADRAILFASGILSRGDREQVETLLADVVEQWYVLKHTSSEGLRQAFLQRRGLLLDGGESWRLRVESAAVDVLLDHLPWGLSTVTLPWLARPIAIDWPRF
jgi:hypothetical protein